MVVTIIGMISAIAVPRISNAAYNASNYALEATLINVRNSIDCYYAEHNRFPGYDPASGGPNEEEFIKQLTMYSDDKGNTNASPRYPYLYGPYLRNPFPMNPTNKLRTVFVKKDPGDADPADGSYGWVAILSDGDFGISAKDTELSRIGVVDSKLKVGLRLQVQ